MSRRLSFVSVVALAAWLTLPGVAWAEPKVLSSDPPEGRRLHEAPNEVTITFDMPLDPTESTIVVVDECGRRIDDDNPQVTGNEITVGIAKQPSGTYDMQYRAVPPAGATGTGTGSIKFSVHLGDICGPEARDHSGHGGHGDHGGHGGDKGGGHSGGGDHSGHSNSGDGHSDHSGGSHSGGDHSSSGHSDHSSASGSSDGSHSGHSSGGSSSHSGHSGEKSGHGNHRDKGNKGGSGGSVQAAPVAAPQIPSAQPVAATGMAVLLALGMCALLGMGGGYLLRQAGRL